MEINQSSISTSKNQQHPKKVAAIKKINILKKLDVETAKQLLILKDKINKKTYGRKVKDSEIIAAAIRLLNLDHITELQSATYSEKDRLAMAHDEFQRQNGKLSLDQFIGKLMRGEIKLLAAST